MRHIDSCTCTHLVPVALLTHRTCQGGREHSLPITSGRSTATVVVKSSCRRRRTYAPAPPPVSPRTTPTLTPCRRLRARPGRATRTRGAWPCPPHSAICSARNRCVGVHVAAIGCTRRTLRTSDLSPNFKILCAVVDIKCIHGTGLTGGGGGVNSPRRCPLCNRIWSHPPLFTRLLIGRALRLPAVRRCGHLDVRQPEGRVLVRLAADDRSGHMMRRPGAAVAEGQQR